MKVNRIIAGIMAVCVMGFGVPYVNTVAENNSAITASAEDKTGYTEGTYEQLKYKNYGDYIEIYGCDSFATEVVIPAEIEGVPVTSIGYASFYYCSELKSIKIPYSVTSIGGCAFWNCSSLTSVNIPDSVTSIGNHAFYYCKSLTSVNIPDSVTSIGDSLFNSCSNLTSVTIPNGVTSIGVAAFCNCSSLTSIDIPDSITSVGYDAFFGTPWFEEKRKEGSLVIEGSVLVNGRTCTGDFSIPDGVKVILEYAFNGCINLTSVNIPDSVTDIGFSAFYGCSKLTSIEIPASVTSIGSNAFYKCSSLTSIEIPKSVTNIGSGVFRDTPWLKEKQKENPVVVINNILIDGQTCTGDVIIPDGVTSIGISAFSGCTGLTSIEIPDSVTKIGGSAFRKCSSLSSIEIPDSVTTIESYTFSESGLTSIKIPESVTIIDSEAFSLCSKLGKITISNPECQINISDSTISNYQDERFRSYFNGTIYGYENSTAQEYAKYNNNKFKLIGQEDEDDDSTNLLGYAEGTYELLTYRNYGDYIKIYSCDKSAKNVVVPSEIEGVPVTVIGEKAFYSISGLESVEIPGSVKSIGEKAFAYSGVTSLTIPDGVTGIGDYAFLACNSLTSVEIADSVTSIGQAAFIDCMNLQSVKLSNSIKSIEEGTFNTCGQLTSINIPDGVKSIGRCAFYMCNSLKSVKLPESLTSIGEGAFSTCEGLTSVKIPESVKFIDDYAFGNCYNLKSVTVLNPDCSISDEAAISNGFDTKDYYFNGTIYGYENSTAQAYAEKHSNKFKIIGQEDVTGDMNGDNSVSVADAVLLQKYVLGSETLTEEQFDVADMNSDGFVDSFDLVLLRREVIENNK